MASIREISNNVPSMHFVTRPILLDADGRDEHPRQGHYHRFDLRVLLNPFRFPTYPTDGIESVMVVLLRLMPLDSAAQRVTIECMRSAGPNIWQTAHDRFGANSPLYGGWVATQAKILINFHPVAGSRLGRTLPVTITMPDGCDLGDPTEHERMICERYLRRWGLVRDV